MQYCVIIDVISWAHRTISKLLIILQFMSISLRVLSVVLLYNLMDCQRIKCLDLDMLSFSIVILEFSRVLLGYTLYSK